jgi:uncharacterized protein YabE (DUF348 family)
MLLAAVAAAGSLYLSIRAHDVTLVVDGRPRAVATMDGSVSDLLHAHGIDADSVDQVVPSPSTEVTGGMTVVVDLEGVAAASPQGSSGVWVVEGTDAPLANASGQLAGDPTLVRGPAGSSSIRDASVVVRGNEHDVTTNASTVGELLSAMGIRPDGDDRVLPPPSSPLESGSRVRVVQIRVLKRTVRSSVPFSVRTRDSTSLAEGEVRVVRPGSRGTRLRTFRIKVVDGKRVGRSLIRSRVTSAAVDERRVVVADRPDPAPTGSLWVQSGESTW